MVGKRRWSGRTSGANIPNVRVWLCESCHAWHKLSKPAQCGACGCMAFFKMDSMAEAKRFGELSLEVRVGLIKGLECQKRFPLLVNNVKIGTYVADFAYSRGGAGVVEDVKGGADTTMSAWKRKHVAAQYGFEVSVVRR